MDRQRPIKIVVEIRKAVSAIEILYIYELLITGESANTEIKKQVNNVVNSVLYLLILRFLEELMTMIN